MDIAKTSQEIIEIIKLNTSTLGEAHQIARCVESKILKKILSIGKDTEINQSGNVDLI